MSPLSNILIQQNHLRSSTDQMKSDLKKEFYSSTKKTLTNNGNIMFIEAIGGTHIAIGFRGVNAEVQIFKILPKDNSFEFVTSIPSQFNTNNKGFGGCDDIDFDPASKKIYVVCYNP